MKISIKNAFDVSKETLQRWAEPIAGMGAKEYYEEISYLERYPVIEGFTISLHIFKRVDSKSSIDKEELLIENVKKKIQKVISSFIHSPLIKVAASEKVHVRYEDHYVIEEVIPSKQRLFDLFDRIQSVPGFFLDILKRHLEEIIKLDYDAFSYYNDDFVQLIDLCEKLYNKYYTPPSD